MKFGGELESRESLAGGLVDVISLARTPSVYEHHHYPNSPPSDPLTCVYFVVNMSLLDSCCTCATLLSDVKVPYDPESEKPLLYNRRLDCCSRYICAACQHKNPRFTTYCPFCQISTVPTALPKDGLRLPPSYAKTADSRDAFRAASPPPSYDDSMTARPVPDQSTEPPADTEDTVHFLGSGDTLQALSLAYAVPVFILRRHNNLYADQLLQARKWILIPRTHYGGPPLSTAPDPLEEERKTKLRRWMVATKCAEYNVAQLYLKGSDYNLDVAVEAFKADEEWEKNHPLEGKCKGKEKHRSRIGRGGSLGGQLS